MQNLFSGGSKNEKVPPNMYRGLAG